MNPEDKVIDAIDALVDEQLTHTPDNYDRPFAESCDLCCHEWHGLPDCPHCDCPGMYATTEQREAFVKPRPTTARKRAVAVPRRDINLDVPALSDVLVRLWDCCESAPWGGGGGGRGAPWLNYHDNPWHTPDNPLTDEDIDAGGFFTSDSFALDDTTAAEYIRAANSSSIRCAQCQRYLPGVIIPEGFADVYCAECHTMRGNHDGIWNYTLGQRE